MKVEGRREERKSKNLSCSFAERAWSSGFKSIVKIKWFSWKSRNTKNNDISLQVTSSYHWDLESFLKLLFYSLAPCSISFLSLALCLSIRNKKNAISPSLPPFLLCIFSHLSCRFVSSLNQSMQQQPPQSYPSSQSPPPA
jgi:hypothetical protein